MTSITRFKHPFLEELLYQFRLEDRTGTYQNISDHSLLNSWLSFNQLEQDLIQLQIKAFYQAVANLIERQTGKIAQIVLNLNPEKSSSALICCGNLLVVYQLVKEINCFSFDSIETMAKTADNLVDYSVSKIQQFF